MLKKMVIPALFLAAVLAVGCGSVNSKKGAATKAAKQQLVGNDRDSHGCIASAGYQWSELLQECIRPFEKGLRLDPVAGNPVNGMTCLVFNADSSKVEVFLPASEKRPILERQPNGECWRSDAMSSLSVQREGDGWTASLDGEVKYRSK